MKRNKNNKNTNNKNNVQQSLAPYVIDTSTIGDIIHAKAIAGSKDAKKVIELFNI